MARKLNISVHVEDPATGESRWFGPGDTVPAAWARFIDNPDVWADAPSQDGEDVPAEGSQELETPEGKTDPRPAHRTRQRRR